MKKSNVFKVFPVIMVMGLLVGLAVVSCNKEDQISPMGPSVGPNDTLPQVDTTLVPTADSAILKGKVLSCEGNGMPGSEEGLRYFPFECDVVVALPVEVDPYGNVALSALGVTEVARVHNQTHNGRYRVKIPVGEYSVLPVVDEKVVVQGLRWSGQSWEVNRITVSANEIKTYDITINYQVD
ncbi:MAG: hypothetical protein IKH97_02810 [Bacteroidales bacterium]|nr:hypothetical protein [Bacteroidales bacterium]